MLLKRLTGENRACGAVPPRAGFSGPGHRSPHPEWLLLPPLRAPAAKLSHPVVSPWPSAVAVAMGRAGCAFAPQSWLFRGAAPLSGSHGCAAAWHSDFVPCTGARRRAPLGLSLRAEVRPDSPARESWQWRVCWRPEPQGRLGICIRANHDASFMRSLFFHLPLLFVWKIPGRMCVWRLE